MDRTQLIQLSGAVLASLGGGGIIVFGLSSWLGKFWASKLLEDDKQKYSVALEHLKSP